MSSEILSGNQAAVAAPFWRTVAKVHLEGWDAAQKEDARQTAQALDEARREGFEQGVAAGRSQAEQQILPAMENIARTVVELARLKEKLREETLQDLVRLATSIAARVIHREVTMDPDALAGLVRAAFAKVQGREVSRARVHPSLEPLLRRCLEQCGAPKDLAVVTETGLNPGDLFFETAQGVLDASVETQLREIERGLIDRLEP